MKLANKRALVTGADSGIGQAIAELFAKEGADVAIVYHTDADGAAETGRRVEAAGRRALVMQGDVGDPASVERFFAETADALG
ncbi:SDR family NAD(P)-dependent oxidoreductase [Aureimonas leprariae]|uniref:SDR family NAD(P)-dependent oxidoreductase n=1 Tax=Plantimonas leprariae TaxID=2615207 RepID=A0A7V7PSJ1_9HYPH|nr:SDR family NAD(P)-dependent oxidoreductase [Aureimonas leprariae]KAB0682077.1 SDR family NAD(P)-dependent oxidoreductase [Aureimonas leprariae]